MTTPTPPAVVKTIEYDRESHDYAAYVAIDGEARQLIGYEKTYDAAEKLCRDYTFNYYSDNSTPEAAAQYLEEPESRPSPKLNELRSISAEIADYIEHYYADLPDETPFLDITTPQHMAHQVAERWPGLGAAFYLLVADAASEQFSHCIGMPTKPPPADLPRISSALAGLINSKDSGWF